MKRGEPAWGERTGEDVAFHRGAEDARWSYLYGDTEYEADPGAERPGVPPAPRIPGRSVGKAPVWTWEVPLYFWFGGIAAGASFAALACDVSGDRRSARIARLVAVGALVPTPPLLVMDLGRPERFLNMLRVFKPRSPMSTGAWCLSLFGALGSAAVAADHAGRDVTARRLGAANAVVGGYLGSYTGVLLAATAVPLWSRSQLLLGPIFVATATATGTAAVRLAVEAAGGDRATLAGLARAQSGAMAAELALAAANERRLGEEVAAPLHRSKLLKGGKWAARVGLAAHLGRRHRAASCLHLLAGLLFRYAWVEAGKRR